MGLQGVALNQPLLSIFSRYIQGVALKQSLPFNAVNYIHLVALKTNFPIPPVKRWDSLLLKNGSTAALAWCCRFLCFCPFSFSSMQREALFCKGSMKPIAGFILCGRGALSFSVSMPISRLKCKYRSTPSCFCTQQFLRLRGMLAEEELGIDHITFTNSCNLLLCIV